MDFLYPARIRVAASGSRFDVGQRSKAGLSGYMRVGSVGRLSVGTKERQV
jgi:hypothetical protein